MIPGDWATPALRGCYGSAAAFGGYQLAARQLAIGNYPEFVVVRDLVLLPGWGVYLYHNQTGTGMTIYPTFEWYERVLEEQERTG
jgi:hypothetical protein